MFGGETSSSVPSDSLKTEEIKLAVTDEIKNAALGSGLVQYNNDIFQCGGYMTVANFVEKYKDNYDITYSCPQGSFISTAGTYDECKDYLLEYTDEIFEQFNVVGRSWGERKYATGLYKGMYYSLTLTPKNGSAFNPVTVYVVNATSPDEKITLENAIVVEIESARDGSKRCITPEWFPMGLNDFDFKNKFDSENKSYTVKNLGEALEAKGLKKNGEEIYEEYRTIPYMKEENYNTYWVAKSYAGCYVLGEKNLFGAKPLYYYSFNIDSNTDKLDYAKCSLEYFVKD